MTGRKRVNFAILPTDSFTGIRKTSLEALRLAEAGSSYPEISTALSIPLGTVKSKVNRARARVVANRRAPADSDLSSVQPKT